VIANEIGFSAVLERRKKEGVCGRERERERERERKRERERERWRLQLLICALFLPGCTSARDGYRRR
jgi:hypothetical protein